MINIYSILHCIPSPMFLIIYSYCILFIQSFNIFNLFWSWPSRKLQFAESRSYIAAFQIRSFFYDTFFPFGLVNQTGTRFRINWLANYKLKLDTLCVTRIGAKRIGEGDNLKELRHGWRILKNMANFFKFAIRNWPCSQSHECVASCSV